MTIHPTLAQIAKHAARNSNDQRYVLDGHPDPVRALTAKAIAAMSGADFGVDASFTGATAQWFSTLGAEQGAFFALLNRQLMFSVPLHCAIGVGIGSLGAGIPGEAVARVLSRMTFDRSRLEPRTAIGEVVVTQEMLDAVGASGNDAVDRAANLALNNAADGEIANDLTTSVVAGGIASGNDAGSARRDIRTALRSVFSSGQPTNRGVWIMAPDVAIDLSCLAADGGGPATFPDMTPSGGSLVGLLALVSSGWPEGTLTLLDGNQAVGGSDLIGLQASRAGAYSAALSPTQNAGSGSGAEGLVSAYQTNTVLIRAAARFTFAIARDTAAFTLSGCAYDTAAS